MSEPQVLISHPMLASLQAEIEAGGLRVARGWELKDEERGREDRKSVV